MCASRYSNLTCKLPSNAQVQSSTENLDTYTLFWRHWAKVPTQDASLDDMLEKELHNKE